MKIGSVVWLHMDIPVRVVGTLNQSPAKHNIDETMRIVKFQDVDPGKGVRRQIPPDIGIFVLSSI
jgi:hypothetical protein